MASQGGDLLYLAHGDPASEIVRLHIGSMSCFLPT